MDITSCFWMFLADQESPICVVRVAVSRRNSHQPYLRKPFTKSADHMLVLSIIALDRFEQCSQLHCTCPLSVAHMLVFGEEVWVDFGS